MYRYRYRVCYSRPYRYQRPVLRLYQLTEVPGTGIVMLYPTYRSICYPYESLHRYRRYRYPYCTELTKFVIISVRYRYSCLSERTEVSGTGIDVVPIPVPAPVKYFTAVPACIHFFWELLTRTKVYIYIICIYILIRVYALDCFLCAVPKGTRWIITRKKSQNRKRPKLQGIRSQCGGTGLMYPP